MEKFTAQQSILEIPSSKEGIIFKNLVAQLEARGKNIATASEDDVREILDANKKVTIFGLTTNGIIAEIKNIGHLKPVPVVEVKKKKAVIKPALISNRIKLEGFKELDKEEFEELLEQNNFYEELAGNIFKNENDLQAVYDQTLALEKDYSMETPEYYKAFAGLVKRGIVEINEDLEDLAIRLQMFKENLEALPDQEAARAEKMKKVATIVERAIIYAVTTVGWYGDGISIEQTSQFDDVKRGVDGVLQIRREAKEEDDGQNMFLALGIDATFRGLMSKEYRNKFSKLLESIWKNKKTKIKYFKNHQGDLMEEFAAPKVVLYFDNKDVKNLVNMVKNSNDAEAMEKFKNDPQKITTMNQILIQCQILSEFAKECNNSISDQYDECIDAIYRLGKKDPEIQAMIDTSHEGEVTHHMRYLVTEFKRDHEQLAA